MMRIDGYWVRKVVMGKWGGQDSQRHPLPIKAILFLLIPALSFFLALHSLSPPQMHFRSSPFDPLQAPLFSYPSTYGEHKHAIPTTRSSCDSPVFSLRLLGCRQGYASVTGEFHEFGGTVSEVYSGNAESFGGNLSFQKRISYFDHSEDEPEIPCGFFRDFPITNSDRIAMESCDGIVVASAIFNDHDKIRQPRGLGSQNLDYVCFFMFVDDVTLKTLHFHKMTSRESEEHKIGAWRVVKVASEHLYENAAMNGGYLNT
ncbi:UNVERIFIED_CONTAM: hypothetical protein Sangu_2349300 [Sesamum angustifolium]|uniref:TOD1/MUCI70 glycosyltransferase-like domain-containing protein n=1 Tax=Sesamum angustifolium TaxID=2727405 RepID=A0AAW2KU68_9LAMI